MKQAKLSSVILKYETYGVRKGSEFLLPPPKALELINDLENAGIELLGISVWQVVQLLDGSTGIAEDLAYDLFVPEKILQSEDVVRQSAAIVRGFIERLPENTDFVSIVLYSNLTWMTPDDG